MKITCNLLRFGNTAVFSTADGNILCWLRFLSTQYEADGCSNYTSHCDVTMETCTLVINNVTDIWNEVSVTCYQYHVDRVIRSNIVSIFVQDSIDNGEGNGMKSDSISTPRTDMNGEVETTSFWITTKSNVEESMKTRIVLMENETTVTSLKQHNISTLDVYSESHNSSRTLVTKTTVQSKEHTESTASSVMDITYNTEFTSTPYTPAIKQDSISTVAKWNSKEAQNTKSTKSVADVSNNGNTTSYLDKATEENDVNISTVPNTNSTDKINNTFIIFLVIAAFGITVIALTTVAVVSYVSSIKANGEIQNQTKISQSCMVSYTHQEIQIFDATRSSVILGFKGSKYEKLFDDDENILQTA